MPDYGLTSQGPNIKRLDVILDEMHSSISEKVGVNTRQNPQSLLNHILTNIADRIAECWEFGADIYYAMYPSTAEGVNLDNAAQFGGSTRELPAPSYYHILCTGVDGTVVPADTIIASDTNPATQLVLNEDGLISRSGFNTVGIKASVSQLTSAITVVINGNLYSYTPKDQDTITDALGGLAETIDDDDFTVSVDDENGILNIMAVDPTASNTLVLSENLTTETVGTVMTFGTVENGDILLPNGVITVIVKAVTGLQSVVNVGAYIAGQLAEDDVSFRQSYIDKIYSRSSRMLESIRSTILDNVQGVSSVAPYENDTNQTDSMGRPPHSIEVVVDGGDQSEIAQQILETKAGGISTYGSITVNVPGVYGEDIPIRFNRPTYKKIWFHVAITILAGATLPSNYADLIDEIIIEQMESIECGEDVIPQKELLGAIYKNVSGIAYLDITMEATDNDTKPQAYTKRSISISQRERAVTDATKIEVVLDE